VEISGRGFADGVLVQFGSDDATGVVVLDGGQRILCLTPAGAVGFVDVTVTNPDGGQCSMVNGYEYTPPPASMLLSAEYIDTNADGILGGIDTIRLTFTGAVSLSMTTVPADATLVLMPPGSFGTSAFIQGTPRPNQLTVVLGDGASLQPNGTFGLNPLSTGLDVLPSQMDVLDRFGAPLVPLPEPVDVGGMISPRVAGAAYTDQNTNCIVDAGDTLDVTFTANVTLVTADPAQAFQLPVTGDGLGGGARFSTGSAPSDVRTATIVLGTTPVLRLSGIYDAGILFQGSPSGIDVAPGSVVDAFDPAVPAVPQLPPGRDLPDADAIWTTVGPDQENACLGTAVASAGDVNGDGYDDVLIGAPGFDGAASDTGIVYVYHGGPAGLAPLPAWSASGDSQGSARFGEALDGAGDVNGDGFDDVLVGAPSFDAANPNAGKAYLYLGGPTGLAALPAWTSVGDDEADARFAWSVSSAGDLNGDGCADVAVGAPGYDTSVYPAAPGTAFVFTGGPSGLSATPAWTSSGEGQPEALFGAEVASAGDVNGDTFDDLIVGAPAFDVSLPDLRNAGKAYLYFGGVSGLPATASSTCTGPLGDHQSFGNWIAGVGDINGDGYDDVLFGMPSLGPSIGYFMAGIAYLHAGGPGGISAGYVWRASGDWVADARFGGSVAGVGDTDGDGYDDLLVGAPEQWITPSPDGKEGKAFLYLGAPGWPSVLPEAWTSTGDAQVKAYFGKAVDSAGDVNGDGFPEVLVGAPYYDAGSSGTGKAYVFCVGR
jgi:hypothetical protein